MGGASREKELALLLHTMLTSQTVKAVNPEMEEPLTPKEPPVYETAEGERRWRCKDFMVGLIFLTGVSFMLFGLIHNREALEQKWDSATDSLKTEFGALSAAQTVGASFGVAVVFSAIWLIFVRYCVKVAVYGLFAMTLAAEAAGAGGLFYLANTQVADGTWEQTWLNGFAVVVTLLFAYTSYIVYSLCDRVALAASMIKVAGRVLQEVPTVFAVDALLAVVKFLWMIFCGAAAWAIIGNTTQDTFWVGTGLALMSYWGLQVLGNIVLVASYGALGQWYYNNRATMAGPLLRATTVHFGSVCFGSLLVAMVETLHDVFQVLAKKQYIPQWAMCCIDRALAVVESTFDYINKYGFVQVAIHDESFLTASHRALEFLKYKGLTALVNDSIVHRLAQVGAVAGGILSGVMPVLVMRAMHHQDVTSIGLNSDQETALAFAGFFLGSAVVYTLISPFPAMVTALLVCFAEHPEVLARDHPEHYEALIEPWEAVYGQNFVDKAATVANLDVEGNLITSAQTKYHPLAEELEKLVTLKEAGELTESEFTAAKDKLLTK